MTIPHPLKVPMLVEIYNATMAIVWLLVPQAMTVGRDKSAVQFMITGVRGDTYIIL